MTAEAESADRRVARPFQVPKDAAEAVALLEDNRIERVHVGIFDLDGVFREQRLPIDQAKRALEGDYSFCNVLYRWDTGESVFAEPPFVSEEVLVDPASLRSYPFEPDSALFVADYGGPSRALSPRELLNSQLAKAGAMGVGVLAAFEFEFIVLAESAASLREKRFGDLTTFADDNRCWSGTSAATNADLVSDLEAVVRAMGLGLHRLGMELGPGCFEATLSARDALAAADDAALFKNFTKAFFRRRDMTASFMAQLADHLPGLSGHLHLSLVDSESGRSIFHDDADPSGMSTTMRHFIGGLLTLMPECLALCAHTVNAYRRMVPGNWAPRTPTWGPRNYSAAVRTVVGDADTSRLEFRVPAADTNPFLAMAMCLGAGLKGIAEEIEPPPAIEGDARDIVPEGLRPLPRNLTEATDRLDNSQIARECFTDVFVDHFVRSRRREIDSERRHVSAYERARYLEVV